MLSKADKKLLLHQVELVGPNRIAATHNHGSVAFGDRLSNGGDALAHSGVPGRLHGCQGSLRGDPLERDSECGGGGSRGSTVAHAAAASGLGGAILSEASRACGGTDSSAAAVINACPLPSRRSTRRARRSGSSSLITSSR